MAKRKFKQRAARHSKKVKLHNLAQLITPRALEPDFLRDAKVRTDLPVFVCGTNASIDPRNPEGMSRLAAEAIADARSHLSCRAAHGLGDNTTVIIQTANGWMVRNRHGDIDNVQLRGRIHELDERATSKHANRERREKFEQSNLATHLKNRALRTLREERGEAVRQAEILINL